MRQVHLTTRAQPASASPRATLGASEMFCRDLTQAARDGHFRRLFLRRTIEDQLLALIAKMDKPTVVLTGKAGVGKSCNVCALVQRISEGDALPADIAAMRVLELEVPAFLAGATPGELERRAVRLCQDARAAGRGVILFVDEAHTLLDARVGSLSLGDILKPSLARGEISCIAATTDDGYRATFETDDALARRFQRVDVPEPDEDETFQILLRSVPGLAQAHGMLITADDVRRAVVLSRRYVRHRANPDKANDLLDEAMALQRVEFDRTCALRNGFAERLQRGLTEARTDGNQSEERRLDGVLDALTRGLLPLDSTYLGKVIHRWTGLPTEVLGGSARPLNELLPRLRTRVVGQNLSLSRLADAAIRGLTGVARPKGPLASAFICGPTGCGKTETARALAECVLGDAAAMLRIDGSEYAEAHSVARLIGSPPGYVGFHQGGELTAFGRDHQFGIILLDEAEKANGSVHDVFLQILEEGELRDGRGVRVDFSGHFVLFTSNADLGASGGGHMGFSPVIERSARSEGDEAGLRQRLSAYFRRELVNRLDLVLEYQTLSPEQVREIVRLTAAAFCARMRLERQLEVVVKDEVIEQMSVAAYNPAWGGREVRRVFDRVVAQEVGAWIARNPTARGVRITVTGRHCPTGHHEIQR